MAATLAFCACAQQQQGSPHFMSPSKYEDLNNSEGFHPLPCKLYDKEKPHLLEAHNTENEPVSSRWSSKHQLAKHRPIAAHNRGKHAHSKSSQIKRCCSLSSAN